MGNHVNKRLTNNVVSPCGLAMISYAFFLFACTISPAVYSRYMHEPDLMFLDAPTILFYTSCVAGFIAGVMFMTWLLGPARVETSKLQAKFSPALFLLIPLLLGIGLVVIEIKYLFTTNPSLLLLLMAQQGGSLKADNGLETANRLTMAPVVLSGIVWWAYWRLADFDLKGWSARFVTLALWVAVIAVMVSSTLSLSRIRLLLVLVGLLLLYVVRKTARGQLTFKFALAISGAAVICIALLFFALSYLRGDDGLDQFALIIGYTVASYNRLASMVNGGLRYPFGGHGVYLSGFVSYSTTLNKLIPLAQILNWPGYYQLWASEFGAVTQAGLDGSMIWSGTFGYIFSDLGWFSALLVSIYGMFHAIVWKWMKNGKTIGVVLYPYAAFCTLLWISNNALTDSLLIILLAVALLLTGYESVLAKVVRG